MLNVAFRGLLAGVSEADLQLVEPEAQLLGHGRGKWSKRLGIEPDGLSV